MAFKLKDINNYGNGSLGDITNPTGQINSYANVTALSGNVVTISTPSVGIYENFVVGNEVLLHVSAIISGTDLQYLGNYIFAKITAVNDSVLTLDKDVSGLVGSSVFTNHQIQIVTVAQFNTLNLTSTIAPLTYSITNKYGGIVAFKCKTAFNYSSNAAINTVAKGIPITNLDYRPNTTQEANYYPQLGWENHITSRKLYMNSPDGIVFIAAKTSSGAGTDARFGGTVAGVTHSKSQYGGPTIMWISETITGFDPSVIAKTSSNISGRGLSRCYIATESKLQADEYLYSLDCLSNPARIISMGIKDFGTGTLGNALSINGQANSYTPVISISQDGCTINIGSIYQGSYETFTIGTRILFHVTRQTGTDNAYVGKFIQTKIISVTGSSIVVDTPIINIVPYTITSNYKCQLITLAQFDTLTLSTTYTGAKAYDDTAGCGGILALSAKTKIDLSNGILDMSSKGISGAVSRPFVAWQCSGHQADCLPLSQGNGAILLIAKTINMNATTRLGTSISGAGLAGIGGLSPTVTGTSYSPATPGGAGYCGGGAAGYSGSIYEYSGSSGSLIVGGNGGSYSSDSVYGMEILNGGVGSGWGCKGIDGNRKSSGGTTANVGGNGGASIFIIADTINNFNIASISTGGDCGKDSYSYWGSGGGGGGAGTCFIYCNNVNNPDYTAFQTS